VAVSGTHPTGGDSAPAAAFAALGADGELAQPATQRVKQAPIRSFFHMTIISGSS
jgi:hypothetical protein